MPEQRVGTRRTPHPCELTRRRASHAEAEPLGYRSGVVTPDPNPIVAPDPNSIVAPTRNPTHNPIVAPPTTPRETLSQQGGALRSVGR